jgi:hypothetical protein
MAQASITFEGMFVVMELFICECDGFIIVKLANVSTMYYESLIKGEDLVRERKEIEKSEESLHFIGKIVTQARGPWT